MSHPAGRAIHALRWWIGAVLFASTIINYIDRQTLSLLAPYLKVGLSLVEHGLCVSGDRFSFRVLRSVKPSSAG